MGCVGITGAAGTGFTVAVALPAVDVHIPTVIVTLYTPFIAVEAFGRVNVFTLPGANPSGVVQVYVAPLTTGVVTVNPDPAHGVVIVTVGAAGTAFITGVVVDVAVQPFNVAVTV